MVLFAILYKQKEKTIHGIILLDMSKLDDIKLKEIEAAITFYQDNKLPQDEICEKISSIFDISKEEIEKISLRKKETTNF